MALAKNKIGDKPALESPDTPTVTQGAEPAAAGPGAVGDPIETPSLFRVPAAGATGKPQGGRALALLNVGELLNLRAEIDVYLPPRNIAEMNLEEEVILQYYLAKEMVRTTSTDSLVPANQKAQVLNSCAAILRSLADAQTALYTAERVKIVQQAIERAFVGQDDKVKRAFFDRYSKLLREAVAEREAKGQKVVREKPLEIE